MAVGTQLAVLRQMLYAECGEESDETISPALVPVYNQLLNNQQQYLDGQNAYLRGKTVAGLAAVVGQQYYNLPAGIDFDQIETPTFTNVVSFRYRIGYGIGQEEYNIFRSDLGVTASPVMRWQLVNVNGVQQIELWPIPSVVQTIEFTGLLPLTPMVQDTDVCVIDDLALVLFTAAKRLARQGKADAQETAARAMAHLNNLRAKAGSKFDVFNLAGQQPRFDEFYKGNNRQPVVAVNTGGH